ncbi:hypothetical protein BEN47_18690 [Hymenobacter lapidarius]|uniref:DUF86 domain-containing protein n=1 Tax=Hymenobacter lapidarius TaxID=1908237 RepID=A0A1G1SUA8_9BACT|nr:DUF86 domain-containing protein [Hymenobacter lapidarius]OGX82215.1 hypothetical protein BEN47_18690 [Hymenobacter lapidarius]
MSRSPLEFLRHIQDELDFLERYRSLPDLADLVANPEAARAVLHSLLIIGEAVKNVPADWREKYSQVPWRNMARMHDKIVHHYFDVNYPIVWNVLKNDLPKLRQTVELMLRELT